MKKTSQAFMAASTIAGIALFFGGFIQQSSAASARLNPASFAEKGGESPAKAPQASSPLPVGSPIPAAPTPTPTPSLLSPAEIGLRYFSEGSVYAGYVGKDASRQPELVITPPVEIVEIDRVDSFPGSYLERMLEGRLPNGKLIQGETEALNGLIQLMGAARDAGFASQAVRSAYRSFQTQTYLQQVDGLQPGVNLAAPGRSEHELGTAFDVSWRGELMSLEVIRGTEDAAAFYEWLKSHAHIYGFVISYPYKAMGWQSNVNTPFITEYIAEPWHVRYVTPEFAQAIFDFVDEAGQNYQSPASRLVPQDFYASGS